jgi:hypothetical protein
LKRYLCQDELALEWATPLFVVTFDDVQTLNQQLTATILRKEKQFSKRSKPAKHTPQYWNHFSSFHYRQDLFSWRARPIATLRQMIVEATERFTRRYFGDRNFTVTRLAGWANVSRSGDWHGPHNHFSGGQYLSGVYWISNNRPPSDMFDLDGNLVYLDPRGYGSPARYDVVFGTREGRMVLQPPWLGHIVTPKRSADLRISIAFDIFVDRNPWWDAKAHILPDSDSR